MNHQGFLVLIHEDMDHSKEGRIVRNNTISRIILPESDRSSLDLQQPKKPRASRVWFEAAATQEHYRRLVNIET